jgi:hypothetical protein
MSSYALCSPVAGSVRNRTLTGGTPSHQKKGAENTPSTQRVSRPAVWRRRGWKVAQGLSSLARHEMGGKQAFASLPLGCAPRALHRRTKSHIRAVAHNNLRIPVWDSCFRVWLSRRANSLYLGHHRTTEKDATSHPILYGSTVRNGKLRGVERCRTVAEATPER